MKFGFVAKHRGRWPVGMTRKSLARTLAATGVLVGIKRMLVL